MPISLFLLSWECVESPPIPKRDNKSKNGAKKLGSGSNKRRIRGMTPVSLYDGLSPVIFDS
jgi:hypothetical protein